MDLKQYLYSRGIKYSWLAKQCGIPTQTMWAYLGQTQQTLNKEQCKAIEELTGGDWVAMPVVNFKQINRWTVVSKVKLMKKKLNEVTKKKVVSHLKGDVKSFKKEAAEDKKLIKKLKKK